MENEYILKEVQTEKHGKQKKPKLFTHGIRA